MEHKYYLHDGQSQVGPFSITELQKRGISPSSFIWREGLASWSMAKDIPELKSTFNAPVAPPPFSPPLGQSTPPPLRTSQPQAQPIRRKSNGGLIAGLIIGVVLIAGGVIATLFVVNQGSNNPESFASNFSEAVIPVREKTPEELRAELKEKELSNPDAYLSATASWRTNLIGETVFEGSVSNTASVASYKDYVLQFTYYSKTGTYLDSESFTIYERLAPGKSKSFKIKTYTSDAVQKFDVDVVKATGIR